MTGNSTYLSFLDLNRSGFFLKKSSSYLRIQKIKHMVILIMLVSWKSK